MQVTKRSLILSRQVYASYELHYLYSFYGLLQDLHAG